MKIKLPKIHLLLDVNKKKDSNHPTKNIYIKQGYGIVSNDMITVVNLREYVKRELDIDDEEDLKELTSIIDWMEGKTFSKEFWAEIAGKELMVELVDDDLIIENESYNKTLSYTPYSAFDTQHILDLCKGNFNKEDVAMERTSVSGHYFASIAKAFSSELAADVLLFAFSGTGSAVSYSFRKRDYIFGVIPESMEGSADLTAFMNTRAFETDILF